MTPVDLLDDHTRRPRNLGKLMAASAVGDVGSIIAGDALRFYVLVDAGVVAQARFQVFNCQGQLGATSALTELVTGKTLAEARALGQAEVCAHLGGLDHTWLPPQLWGIEALHACLDALESRTPVFDVEHDPLLCRCFAVSEQTVREAISVRALTTVAAVGEATGAGTGCGSCQSDIQKLIDGKDKPRGQAAKPAAGQPVAGRIALLRRIESIVLDRFLPEVRALGGELELWDFDGRIVRVKAKGRLAEDETLRSEQLAKLEALLKAEVDPTIGVGLG